MARTLLDDVGHAARTLLNRTPVPYTGNGNLRIPWRQPTGAEAQMRSMGSVGTLFSIVNRTSNATALVKWHLYRKAASGLDEDRVEVTQHAALDLLCKPNPFFTQQELFETTQQHVDLCGEGWWVIAYNPMARLPLELWPVRPDRIAPVPHPTDFLSGYIYTAPDGQEIPLARDEVIQIRMPNPLDPYRGLGPVQSVLTEIDAARYSAEWNRNFFRNSAEPGGILESERRLSDTEFDEVLERWSTQHKGVSNAGRVAVIENGLKWVDRKYTQRDMQFAELRQVSRDVLREAFGAPAFVLGEVGDVNRATAEASKVLFAEQLTVPRLERFKQALNNDLLPLYGKDAARTLEFDYEDPVPPDAAARNAELTTKATAAQALIEAGFYAPDVREALGLPEMAFGQPDADPDRELLIDLIKGAPAQLGTVILPMLGFDLPEQPAPPAPVAPAPAAPAPAARLDLHHHVPYALPARQPSYNAAVLERPRRTARAAAAGEGALDQVREQFESALAELLEAWEPIAEAQLDELVAQIEAAVDAGDTEALADLSVGSDEAARTLRLALGAMAETAAEQMAAEAAEQGVTVRPPKLDKALTNAFGSQLVEVAAAAAGLLALDLAGSAGREALRLMTPDADGAGVAAKVATFMRGLKNWFRRDHLGGALHRAQNIGRLATLAAAPPARYRADETLDKNTCGPCRAIDGTEWDTLAEAQAVYGAGGYLECEGGVRCRGTVTAFWDSTEEASMGRTRRCWNKASVEEIAARGRAMRPALAPPDGGDEGWYRITNNAEAGAEPSASVHIYGDIGSWGISAAAFVDELKMVDAAEIRLFINSPGGEVFDGLAIHNALRSHRAKVMVQVDSLAASIASVIAMAGDRIVMSPHSQMMIHDAQGVSCGSPEELREYADFLDRQSDNIAAVYAERAGGTVKQWRARMRAESWYFADEAVEAGLADEVAAPPAPDEEEAETDRARAAAWDLSVYNYAHTSREDAPAPELPVEEEPTPAPAAVVPDASAITAAVTAANTPEPVMPGFDPDQFRDLMASVAHDAPAAPAPERPTLAAAPALAVPEHQAPPPLAETAVAYFRTLMANAATDLAAPDQAAAPDPAPAEPIRSIDPTAFERSLREARL
ncbi:head maturation protease, ClpP-related [Streptomyces sp. NPDC006422]|uniref:head maturation protease, ClpP-related n=1 Tax=unclassified Streptomyces TaxID=2593676 RepID=UPI0033B7ECA6